MLVMLAITLLLTPKLSATNLCIQCVSSFVIGLRDQIADVLMAEGETNATDMHELDCTAGESKLLLVIRRPY